MHLLAYRVKQYKNDFARNALMHRAKWLIVLRATKWLR
jgi:hypothetical protein